MHLDPVPPVPAPVVPLDCPMAYFDGLLATDLLDVVDLAVAPEIVDRAGWWAVVATFEGALMAYRFGHVRPAPLPVRSERGLQQWIGPAQDSWRSSMDRAGYVAGVERIRERIAAGFVYQVNLCRMLDAPLPQRADPLALAATLSTGNPAPYQGVVHTGDEWVVTASPELFLAKTGRTLTSSPVKGTARPSEPFSDKDFPENIMITDLVRNDLGAVADAGSVTVSRLLAREEHPGISHLVSTVKAQLAPGLGWKALLEATFPPGSVSGAPKHTALQVISDLEGRPRGPYCGAVGYIDSEQRSAVLAVGIRTFFTTTQGAGRTLNFGTGAGITYASDPDAEWQETELKAARLIALASS